MLKWDMPTHRLLYYKTNYNIVPDKLKRMFTDSLKIVKLLAVINSSIYSFV